MSTNYDNLAEGAEREHRKEPDVVRDALATNVTR